MTRNLRKKNRQRGSNSDFSVNDYAGSSYPSSPSTRSTRSERSESSPAKQPWELRLSLPQLLLLWSVLAGTLVMVFIFGLYAGREQGVKIALDNQPLDMARLAVSEPVVVNSETALTGAVDENLSPKSAVKTQKNLAVEAATKTADSPAVDFRPETRESTSLTKAEDTVLSEETAEPAKAHSAGRERETETSELAKNPAEKSQTVKNAGDTEQSSAKPDNKASAKLAAAEDSSVKTLKTTAFKPGYYLQVSAARNKKEAQAVQARLKTKGLKAQIEEAEVSGSVYYRVVLGPYPNKNAAQANQKMLVSTKAAKGEPFVKHLP